MHHLDDLCQSSKTHLASWKAAIANSHFLPLANRTPSVHNPCGQWEMMEV